MENVIEWALITITLLCIFALGISNFGPAKYLIILACVTVLICNYAEKQIDKK